MDTNQPPNSPANPRWGAGLIISAAVVALSVVASLLIRESGGSSWLALLAAVGGNLLGALLMDLFGLRDGSTLGAMSFMLLLCMLPALWVPDPDAWMRENPLTFGVVVLLAAFMRYRLRGVWHLYAVAAILGAAHILISVV